MLQAARSFAKAAPEGKRGPSRRARASAEASARVGDAEPLGNLQTQSRYRDAAPIDFPHRDTIEGALGQASLAAVHDETGCLARGKVAFTDGDLTHFSSRTPSLRVAAHEAAHQLQHAGKTHDAGLGPEGHANAVAASLDAARSPRPLIGARGAPVSVGERGYEDTSKYGSGGRLGETGETLTFGGHEAYATAAMIGASNANLKARHSGLSITAGKDAKTVEAPDGSGMKTLSRVEAKFDVDPTATKFYGDCRQAAREVMGPSGSTEVEKILGYPGEVPMEIPPTQGPADLLPLLLYIDAKLRATPGFDKMSEEEKRKAAADAYEAAQYPWNLDEDDKKKLRHQKIDKKQAEALGIDEFAKPEVGEAFSIKPADPATVGSYSFHYATVVFVAGPDRVTLENAGGDKDQLTENWAFQTYGSKKDQTFQEKWAGHFGPDTHTIRVRTEPPPPSGADQFPSTPTGVLLERWRKSTSDDENFYLKRELDLRSFYCDVECITQDSSIGSDEVYVLFSAGWGFISGGSADFKSGTCYTFKVKINLLMPVPSPMIVKVVELHYVASDTLLGFIPWPSPYKQISDFDLEVDGAHYRVTIFSDVTGL